MSAPPPLALLAELTHRCPMGCLYCSNPLDLVAAEAELDTDAWRRVFEQAADLGVLQVHLSGGAPAARSDLVALAGHVARVGLYGNLITSGMALGPERIAALALAGLEHVQLSVQDVDPQAGDAVGGLPGAHARKLRVARSIREAGLALTLNVVVHRGNADRVDDLIALALDLGAARVEIAHAQHHGWGLLNRAHLIPTPAQVERVADQVEAARRRLAGRLVLDWVAPDYFARFPKPCMGGWGSAFLVIDPAGRVLPCHAAATIPGLEFENVRDRDLAWIWANSPAFNRFRGVDWMVEPCASCERKQLDWGGCRCQALSLAGDPAAADPVCEKSPFHAAVTALRVPAAHGPPVHRQFPGLGHSIGEG